MERKKGFTLVEVIIVVAIISILASIIIPKFSASRTKTKLVACKRNLQAIAVAMEMYATENNGTYYPSTAYPGFYVNDTCFLKVGGDIKQAPMCPATPSSIGYSYWIDTNLWKPFYVFCDPVWNDNNPTHPGLNPWCPRWLPDRGVIETYN